MSEEETSYTCSSLLRLWMTLSASGTDQDELKQTEASLERKEMTSKTRNTVEMKLKVFLTSASDLGMFLPKCTLLVLLWWLFTPLKSLSVCCSRCPHSSLTSVCCHLLLTDYFYKKIRIKSSARAVTASQLIIWLYCHKRIVGGVITHTHVPLTRSILTVPPFMNRLIIISWDVRDCNVFSFNKSQTHHWTHITAVVSVMNLTFPVQ